MIRIDRSIMASFMWLTLLAITSLTITPITSSLSSSTPTPTRKSTTTTTNVVEIIGRVRTLTNSPTTTDDVLSSSHEVDLDGVTASTTSEASGGDNSTCNFVGEISLGHSLSLNATDRFFYRSLYMYIAMSMTVNRINTLRCGVHIQNQNYMLKLRTFGDHSNVQLSKTIATTLVNDDKTNFFLRPYSSLLTEQVAQVAEENSIVLISGASSKTSVHQNRSYVFGMLPQTQSKYIKVLEQYHSQGAQTVAYLYEADMPSSDYFTKDFVNQTKLQLVQRYQLPPTPSQHDYDVAAETISLVNPDVVVMAVYSGCDLWIQSIQQLDWVPKAIHTSNCIQAEDLHNEVGNKGLAYLMGSLHWSPQRRPIQDPITLWTPQSYASQFEAISLYSATYQSAAASSSISALVQAMELANTYQDSLLVRDIIANHTFDTVYGRTSFDSNGQNVDQSILMQYNYLGNLNVVEDGGMIYPMPSWKGRDCIYSERCTASGGICQANGTCACPAQLTSTSSSVEDSEGYEPKAAFGMGTDAYCRTVSKEDMNYLHSTLQLVGIAFVAIQVLLALFFSGWVYHYRRKSILQSSQPFFLGLILLGCTLCTTSIIPRTLQQGDYRYEQDVNTGDLLYDQPNPDVHRLDISCMASIWLFAIGFVLVFSALFAKVWRMKLITDSARSFRRRKVQVKDVVHIMAIMLGVVFVILLTFQLVDPMIWHRDVTDQDQDGYTIRSIGQCRTENAYSVYIFLIPLLIIAIGCALYTLYLSYITRHHQLTEESTWITLSIVSIFQIFLLALPVMFIFKDDTNASYFVSVGFIFLMSITITLLIFMPKFYALHYTTASANNLGRGISFGTISEPIDSTRLSPPMVEPAAHETVPSSRRRTSFPTALAHVGEGLAGMPDSSTSNSLNQAFGISNRYEESSNLSSDLPSSNHKAFVRHDDIVDSHHDFIQFMKDQDVVQLSLELTNDGKLKTTTVTRNDFSEATVSVKANLTEAMGTTQFDIIPQTTSKKPDRSRDHDVIDA